jgi:hypothetical protein
MNYASGTEQFAALVKNYTRIPKQRGRYTPLGYDPRLEISCAKGVLWIKNGATPEAKTADPGSYLNRSARDGGQSRTARYHSPAAIPETLKVIAAADDGEVVAAQSREHPIHGVQFHPEAILPRMGNRYLSTF